MKSKFIAIAAISILSFFSPVKSFASDVAGTAVPHQSVIDQNDTIVFDLSQSVLSNGKMTFPIVILSNDTINALDLAFQFNLAKFSYDTIFDLTGSIQTTVFYNSVDATARLSSSSFTAYPKYINVFSVRLNVLSMPILPGDIYAVTGCALNGDPCSILFTEPVFAGLPEQNIYTASVYPNPCDNRLNVNAGEKGFVTVCSLDGKVVLVNQLASGQNSFDTSVLEDGNYFLLITSLKNTSVKKIVVQH